MENATYQEGCATASPMSGPAKAAPGPQAQAPYAAMPREGESEGEKNQRGKRAGQAVDERAQAAPQGYGEPQGYAAPQGYAGPPQGAPESGGCACGGHEPQGFAPQPGPMYGPGPQAQVPFMSAPFGYAAPGPFAAGPAPEHACSCSDHGAPMGGPQVAPGHPGFAGPAGFAGFPGQPGFAGHPGFQGHPGQAGGGSPHHPPLHMENRYGQMLSMCNDLMQGKADPSKIAAFLSTGGTHFWKGALVGAAATLLLTNGAVKSALTESFSSLFGGSKSGVDA